MPAQKPLSRLCTAFIAGLAEISGQDSVLSGSFYAAPPAKPKTGGRRAYGKGAGGFYCSANTSASRAMASGRPPALSPA